jgi:hypothetical protein
MIPRVKPEGRLFQDHALVQEPFLIEVQPVAAP